MADAADLNPSGSKASLAEHAENAEVNHDLPVFMVASSAVLAFL
jgi:hypothetical protein